MKGPHVPLLWVGGLVAVAGLLFGNLVVVGIGGAVLLGGLLVGAVRSTRQDREADPAEIGAEARWLLRPIKALRESLEAIARGQGASPEVAVIAQEAIAEADAIYGKAIELVKARESLKRGLKGRGEAETNLGRLQSQLAAATSDSERTALESALAARKQEIGAYDTAQDHVRQIDSRLNEAEATLAELKARLVTGSVGIGTLSEHQDEFGEMVERLKTLGRSFEEAQAMLEVDAR